MLDSPLAVGRCRNRSKASSMLRGGIDSGNPTISSGARVRLVLSKCAASGGEKDCQFSA
jgi:hypothetical protein